MNTKKCFNKIFCPLMSSSPVIAPGDTTFLLTSRPREPRGSHCRSQRVLVIVLVLSQPNNKPSISCSLRAMTARSVTSS